jgi:hypothetical protein
LPIASESAAEIAAEIAADLREALRGHLDRGLHGLCFSPYLEGQAPGDVIGEQQIRGQAAREPRPADLPVRGLR